MVLAFGGFVASDDPAQFGSPLKQLVGASGSMNPSHALKIQAGSQAPVVVSMVEFQGLV